MGLLFIRVTLASRGLVFVMLKKELLDELSSDSSRGLLRMRAWDK